MIRARLVPDTDDLGRVGLARRAQVSARGRRGRRTGGHVHGGRRGTSRAPGLGARRRPPARRSTRATSSPRALPGGQLPRSSRDLPATWHSRVRRVTAAARVLVPFGGAEHEWAAAELGAWIARANDVSLRLRAPPRPARGSATRAGCSPASLESSGCSASRRAAAGRAGRGGHARGEPRHRPPRRWSLHEVAARGSRPGAARAREDARRRRCSCAAGCARAVSRRRRASRASPGRSAPDLPAATRRQACTAAPGGTVPLLARQRAVRDRAGALRPRLGVDILDGSLAVPRVRSRRVRRETGRHAAAAAVSLGPIWAPRGDVPEGGHGLQAGDREDPAVGAELERECPAAALVELAEELPGPDVQRTSRRRSRRPPGCGRRG